MKKVGKKKSSVRDTWIPETWRYNGAGYKVNKKGVIPRKQKYKKILDYQWQKGKDFFKWVKDINEGMWFNCPSEAEKFANFKNWELVEVNGLKFL